MGADCSTSNASNSQACPQAAPGMLLGPPSAQGARVGAIGSGFAALPVAWLDAAAPLACTFDNSHRAFTLIM